MTTVTHMVAGLAITQVVPDPALSLPMAFASHFLLDAVPHNDYVYLFLGTNFKHMHESLISHGLIVVGVGVCLLLSLSTAHPVIAFTGAILGMLPDVLTGLTKRLGHNGDFFNRFHMHSHSTFDLGEWVFNRFATKSERVVYPENTKGFISN